MSIPELVGQARALLQTSQAEKALELLQPSLESQAQNVSFLQIYGETLLENNDLETAYDVLARACELDPSAEAGSEKFFYLGQMVGGAQGLNALDIGLTKLKNQLSLDSLISYLIKKLNQGIFAEIEIWMTDMCMEEEAESKCDELIDYSLSLDVNNPEALSLLSSIRISQQRNDDAKESLLKSWDLFREKKTRLEESANKIQSGNEASNEDAFEVGLEYVELIQPLLTLARFAIELELYDTAATIASNTQDINESILDAYYYEALAYLFNARKLFSGETTTNEEDYRDIDIKLLKKSASAEVKTLLNEAKSSLTQGFKIINTDAVAEADPGLVEQVQELLTALGGPVMSELMPQRGDVEEENWEDEINSDDDN
ncbi:predicted protein [Scheffersomyces stipitis CBS 6054]|uniref:Uncharacterized protein n=1 Tax=Scheffersomyces stipitis (strain ATCC 58785 / CBS 6054 / NBRC 10063 / NRRL Y-11545) TaxID=322104 RepID=A3GHW4_PICST|nr:predicted protein [Scheffersomyces stipitis CBS 6054]EAZ62888.2 predicted protein [Scheffersomyces stipitis CBS 6054]